MPDSKPTAQHHVQSLAAPTCDGWWWAYGEGGWQAIHVETFDDGSRSCLNCGAEIDLRDYNLWVPLLPPDTTEPARTDDAVDCDLFRVIDDSRYSDEFVGIAIRRRRHELSRAVQNYGRRVAEAIRKEGQRRWLSNPPMPERFTVGDCHAIADAIPFEPAPVATPTPAPKPVPYQMPGETLREALRRQPTPDIDPEEVRRALAFYMPRSQLPPLMEALMQAAREYLRLREQPTPDVQAQDIEEEVITIAEAKAYAQGRKDIRDKYELAIKEVMEQVRKDVEELVALVGHCDNPDCTGKWCTTAREFIRKYK